MLDPKSGDRASIIRRITIEEATLQRGPGEPAQGARPEAMVSSPFGFETR
jgi:hypothetical protein